MLAYQIAVLAALCGIALLVRRNLRDYRRPETPPERDSDAPLVSVLVPARNEAANIEACLKGLLAQDYPRVEIVVLDDRSTDDTAERVQRLMPVSDRLRLERGVELPPGWAGKAHACWEAASHARGEWLLFVDADTRHAPDLVSAALAEARSTSADLLSTFPRQVVGSLGEALTVPWIYWVLFTMLPMRRVWSDPSPGFTAACGQFLLARRDAYFETGGHGAIRASLHDGLHLARHFKRCGRRVRLADLSDRISCRMYRGWAECWSGFGRNAFQALGSLPVLALFSTVQAVLFLLPFLFLGAAAVLGLPQWGWLCAVQVGVILGIHAALRRRFGYPRLTVLLHPLAAAAWLAIQWSSWWRARRGAPTIWKGRPVAAGTP